MVSENEGPGRFDSVASSITKTNTPRSKAADEATAAGDPLGFQDDRDDDRKLDMQDLMKDNAQWAERGSKMMQQRISRFREVLREITGLVVFDLMIGVLVLVDTACIVLQQEWYGEAGTLDSTEIVLRGISVAITTAFGVEVTARCVAQVGRGWSWLLALDAFVVLACFGEVVLFSMDPEKAVALRLLRPLRGLRLLRAARGCMRVIRRSERANLALSAFEKSLGPMILIGVCLGVSVLCASVVLVLQIPGIIEELDDPQIQREVLERFGSVLASTNTVFEVCFGSHDLGSLLYVLFAKSGDGRYQLSLFIASVLGFLLITSLCISGVICGVLLSQVITQKGDAEVDGGMESFRKNQEMVLRMHKMFEDAGFGSTDQIDWTDILNVLAIEKDGKALEQSAWEYLLTITAEEDEAPAENLQEDDTKRFRCILEPQGVTMEELQEAYHEMALFGSVSVEDFIFCTFKHVANIKTVSMLSFNHQQNKVFWRIQFHGQLVDEALNEMRLKIGRLHSALPNMISEVEEAEIELKELDTLEARLEQKKQDLRNLIDEKEEECGFAEVPPTEAVQVERDEYELNELLKELESQVAVLSGSAKIPLQPKDATEAINGLADEMVQHLWQVMLEEMDDPLRVPSTRQIL